MIGHKKVFFSKLRLHNQYNHLHVSFSFLSSASCYGRYDYVQIGSTCNFKMVKLMAKKQCDTPINGSENNIGVWISSSASRNRKEILVFAMP